MPRTRNYESILAQIQKLQSEADQIKSRERQRTIEQILTLMERFDIQPEDLRDAQGARGADEAAEAPKRRGRRPAAAAAQEEGASARTTRRGATSRARRATKKAGPDDNRRGKAAVRFRDPDTGNVWTGRGRAPRWLVEAESAGRKREEFAVDAAGQQASAESAAA